ncbi:MAG: hypothetical protein ACOVSW_10105 [Candidatus Kapaibacteriota bacterium]
MAGEGFGAKQLAGLIFLFCAFLSVEGVWYSPTNHRLRLYRFSSEQPVLHLPEAGQSHEFLRMA